MDHLILNGVITRAGENVAMKIIIQDGLTLTTFSNKSIAKEVFALAKKNGKPVRYNEKENVLIHQYPGKSKEVIARFLKADAEKHGGTFQ